MTHDWQVALIVAGGVSLLLLAYVLLRGRLCRHPFHETWYKAMERWKCPRCRTWFRIEIDATGDRQWVPDR